MDKHLKNFAEDKGREIASRAVESYREKHSDLSLPTVLAMNYASGFTTAQLSAELYDRWFRPLRRQTRVAVISAIVSLALLFGAIFYAWSILSFESFSKFLIAFVPAVAGLLFTVAKSYKTWAEAKKALAEAQALSNSSSGKLGNER
jgi:hypothetical protein